LGLTLLVTVVALAISLGKPKQYDASATLLFPQTQPLDALLVPGQTLPQPVDTERETNTDVALATLQPVADRVVGPSDNHRGGAQSDPGGSAGQRVRHPLRAVSA
jgi:uncharacterized protein involved in exopolysaccharide biosynthesis